MKERGHDHSESALIDFYLNSFSFLLQTSFLFKGQFFHPTIEEKKTSLLLCLYDSSLHSFSSYFSHWKRKLKEANWKFHSTFVCQVRNLFYIGEIHHWYPRTISARRSSGTFFFKQKDFSSWMLHFFLIRQNQVLNENCDHHDKVNIDKKKTFCLLYP